MKMSTIQQFVDQLFTLLLFDLFC